mmetsp:Transcript_5080/g.10123  ORF Transcript_5080/g.10123 Transcript_5080/m.10123 type:complete len:203 (-) Transcript_5080:185-793(-)
MDSWRHSSHGALHSAPSICSRPASLGSLRESLLLAVATSRMPRVLCGGLLCGAPPRSRLPGELLVLQPLHALIAAALPLQVPLVEVSEDRLDLSPAWRWCARAPPPYRRAGACGTPPCEFLALCGLPLLPSLLLARIVQLLPPAELSLEEAVCALRRHTDSGRGGNKLPWGACGACRRSGVRAEGALADLVSQCLLTSLLLT